MIRLFFFMGWILFNSTLFAEQVQISEFEPSKSISSIKSESCYLSSEICIAHHYSYINNPILRQQAKMWYDMEASYNRSRAWFTQQYGGAMGEGPNYRASIVPNGIVERMEEQAASMRAEYAWEEFEEEMERALEAQDLKQNPQEEKASAETPLVSSAIDKKIIQQTPELAEALREQRAAKAKLKEAVRLEKIAESTEYLSRDSFVRGMSLDSNQTPTEKATSLRLEAYRTLEAINHRLNQFAKDHPDMAYYAAKTLEYGAAVLHAGMYVTAAVTTGPGGVAALMAMEYAIGSSIQAAIEVGANHAAASASTPEEALRLRESFGQFCEKGLLLGAVAGIGKGFKPLKGEYRRTGGHHVHAKKAFDGHVNYDPKKGFSISEEYMKSINVRHEAVTGAQQRLFKELADSGRPNNIYEHSRIAVESLIECGAERELARKIVAESLIDLRSKGVRNPVKMPWNPEWKDPTL